MNPYTKSSPLFPRRRGLEDKRSIFGRTRNYHPTDKIRVARCRASLPSHLGYMCGRFHFLPGNRYPALARPLGTPPPRPTHLPMICAPSGMDRISTFTIHTTYELLPKPFRTVYDTSTLFSNTVYIYPSRTSSHSRSRPTLSHLIVSILMS